MIRGLWGEAMAMRAMLMANLGYGDVRQAIELCEQALRWVPADSAMVRSIIFYILGNSYESLGDMAPATGALTEAVSLSETTGNLVIALIATYSLARIKEEEGHLQEAVALQRQALALVEKQFGPEAHPDHISPVAGRAYMDMAEILREQNKLEQAKKFLTISLELGRRINVMGTLPLSYLILARILQAQGDETGALEAIQQADQLLYPASPVFHWVKSVQARLWLVQGNLVEAVYWTETCGLSLGPDFNYRQYPSEYGTFVRVWLAQERFEEALSLIERMQAAAQAAGRRGRLLEIMILKALTFYAQGNFQQAFSPLAQALALGEGGGYRRIFIDEGPAMAQLLRLAKSRNAVPNTPYLNELLDAFVETTEPLFEAEIERAGKPVSEMMPQRSPGSRSKTQPMLVEPLSERELEILQLVADGLSNQDIAARLVIAEGTVKKHLHNIFGKLDVRSRTQAIVRATELRLL
jgi:LuxR family maltose regulon positive regulatory protein